MTGDYALRGTVGADVQIADRTNVGLYYQSLQSFRFDNAIQLELGGGQFSRVFDVECDLPENVGLGVAHDGLLDGNLLVAVDVLFKQWSETALFGEVLTDQWVLQLGSQYRAGRCRFRAGYAYAEDATREIPASTVGGVPLPRLTAEADYLQALLPAFNEHRLTVGLGICDVLPNVQMDLFAGYMFEDSKNYGALTTASLESYWIGTGLTWGFCPQE
jgi:long-chain fatty acid transport protein